MSKDNQGALRSTESECDNQQRVSRRSFLKRAGVIGAAGTATIVTGCEPTGTVALPAEVPPTPIPPIAQYPAVPPTPPVPPTGVGRFFTPQETRTVTALVNTILPGDPDDPGAVEAGVVTYIDVLLATADGFNQAVYREPPFAMPYEGDEPPPQAEGAPEVVWVPADQLPRYGYQSIMTPREIYRLGLMALNMYAQQRFGQIFPELSEAQQEEIVGEMAGDGSVIAEITPGYQSIFEDQDTNEPSGYYPPSLQEFYQTVRADIVEGMFADPLYGGNRDFVGWLLIDYPGAQRAYTEENMQTLGFTRLPQSLADLPRFNPGQPTRPEVVLPVSGADEHEQHEQFDPYDE